MRSSNKQQVEGPEDRDSTEELATTSCVRVVPNLQDSHCEEGVFILHSSWHGTML